MTQQMQPVTITDTPGFASLVNAWRYADIWDRFDLVYDGIGSVPERLHDCTIIRSDDPTEPFGVLLQMPPNSVHSGGSQAYTGRKLLAKVRLD